MATKIVSDLLPGDEVVYKSAFSMRTARVVSVESTPSPALPLVVHAIRTDRETYEVPEVDLYFPARRRIQILN